MPNRTTTSQSIIVCVVSWQSVTRILAINTCVEPSSLVSCCWSGWSPCRGLCSLRSVMFSSQVLVFWYPMCFGSFYYINKHSSETHFFKCAPPAFCTTLPLFSVLQQTGKVCAHYQEELYSRTQFSKLRLDCSAFFFLIANPSLSTWVYM